MNLFAHSQQSASKQENQNQMAIIENSLKVVRYLQSQKIKLISNFLKTTFNCKICSLLMNHIKYSLTKDDSKVLKWIRIMNCKKYLLLISMVRIIKYADEYKSEPPLIKTNYNNFE